MAATTTWTHSKIQRRRRLSSARLQPRLLEGAGVVRRRAQQVLAVEAAGGRDVRIDEEGAKLLDGKMRPGGSCAALEDAGVLLGESHEVGAIQAARRVDVSRSQRRA